MTTISLIAFAAADPLIASLRRFAGSDTLPHDDVTLVVLDRAPS